MTGKGVTNKYYNAIYEQIEALLNQVPDEVQLGMLAQTIASRLGGHSREESREFLTSFATHVINYYDKLHGGRTKQ